MERLLSRREVAELLGVPVSTVANWASEAKGPRFLKVGRHARYRLVDVEAWLDAQSIDPAGAA